jgi:subtilase family serine protease
MIRHRRCRYRPRFDFLDGRWLPSVAAVAGLTPAQLAQAYGFGSAANANGAGQTIAVVVAYHDPNLAGDLATFDRANNLPGQSTAQVAGFLSQVNQAGSQTNDSWAGEEALDVEWVHAAAPAAHIVVVEANSGSLSDLLGAVNTAKAIPGVSVVSMSWGTSEFAGETALDSTFTTPSGHTPITFVAASGDSGAFFGASWPASSPNVVAVGGTSLTLGPGGTIAGESGWVGSGGGVSSLEPAPSYQGSAQSTGARTTPDVSIVGDPNTGLSTYVTSPSTGAGSWYVVGGTSASAQVWAGLFADADSARAASGLGTLSTSTALADLYANPSAFRSITTGYNGYTATSGYNLVTGLGSPNFAAIIHSLDPAASTTPSAAPTTTTTTATTTATTSPTATKSPSSGTTTHRGTHSTPTTTSPAIASSTSSANAAIAFASPVAVAPPTIQILGNTSTTAGASSSTLDGGAGTSSATATPGVVAQGPVG